MIYDITLRIRYTYANPAVGGRHLLRLMPLEIPGQQSVLTSSLGIEPSPEERHDSFDFFGNALSDVAFHAPHDTLSFTVRARVARSAEARLPEGAVPLQDLAADLAACRDLGPQSPLHFLAPSLRATPDEAMTAFARAQLTEGMTALEAVVAVGKALHREMKFDPDATTVDTPAAEAFAARHGVCQDFSHIMISALRGIGIPAGYVSGFLRTEPPPGKPRLEGADAMHAWVRAWVGTEAGYVEFDPTNDCTAGPDHVVVGYGRDYSDVAPIKGAMRVAGGQNSLQAVDMIPLQD